MYDSVYGNTELVAKAIAEALEAAGHHARTVRVKEALKARLDGDMLFVGSPTRIGTMTTRVRNFLRHMDVDPWLGKPVAVFDTEAEEFVEGSGATAASKMHDLAQSRGLSVHTPVLKVGVSGVKGPLSTGYNTVVEAYVREFLRAAGSRG